MTRPLRVLAVADTDSYVKWGAALLDRAPEAWQRELLVLASPARPTRAQLGAALAGTRFAEPGGRASAASAALEARVAGLDDIARRVAEWRPDVVLLSVRGPVVRVVLRAALAAASARPIFVSGLPGISIPATSRALAYRAQCDLLVLHSRREVREFGALAERMGLQQRFGLATLPFLPHRDDRHGRDGGDVIFAAQAKVPQTREQRIELLGWLAESARRAPWRRVVVKVRGTKGEPQTHPERYDYADLLAELDPPAPANLVVEGGAMSAHLAGAAALVTVSSTAAIEAIAVGVPVLALDDFGVSRSLINPVFLGSGLLGSSRDLIAGRFRQPAPEWLDDNYFHAAEDADWATAVERVVRERDADSLVMRPQYRGTLGGPLRHAWDRKRALGAYDRSLSGAVALVVGWPAMRAMRLVRGLRRTLRPRPVAPGAVTASAPQPEHAGR